jgi:hypothetical protein
LRDLRDRSEDAVRRFVRGAQRLAHTRAAVLSGWRAIALDLEERGAFELAKSVRDFVSRMPPTMADQAQLIRFSGRGPRVDPLDRTL